MGDGALITPDPLPDSGGASGAVEVEIARCPTIQLCNYAAEAGDFPFSSGSIVKVQNVNCYLRSPGSFGDVITRPLRRDIAVYGS